MEIRHKIATDRKVQGVNLDANRRAYVLKKDDMLEEYPMKFWESADVERWSSVTVTANVVTLSHRGTHVANIVNKDYRFIVIDDVLSVEHRTA